MTVKIYGLLRPEILKYSVFKVQFTKPSAYDGKGSNGVACEIVKMVYGLLCCNLEIVRDIRER